MFEGSMLERVARSFHAVREKTADEYGALSKYSAAMSHVETLEKEVGVIAGNASPSIQMSIADELLEQQAVIRQCVEQLEGCEVSHEMLCSHLKDALFEQVVSFLNLNAGKGVSFSFLFLFQFFWYNSVNSDILYVESPLIVVQLNDLLHS